MTYPKSINTPSPQTTQAVPTAAPQNNSQESNVLYWLKTQQPAFYNLFYEWNSIESMQIGLWHWFRAAIDNSHKPWQYNPSHLLYLHNHLQQLLHIAHQYWQQFGQQIPPATHNHDAEHWLANAETICKQFDGKIVFLSKDETREPMRFFHRLFQTRPLEKWKELLSNWLAYGLSSNSLLNSEAAAEMAADHELLRGLCEAGWLLWQQTQQQSKGCTVTQTETTHTDLPAASLHNYARQDDDLQALIHMIVASMPVDYIFLLGKFPLQPEALGYEYDLLVLTTPTQQRPAHELESLIQNRSEELSPVAATVMQTAQVAQWLQKGNWYLHHCCAIHKLCYNNTGNRLPYQPNPVPPNHNLMQQQFDNFLSKSTGFLTAATAQIEQQEWALAAFMLHQCLEAGLNALITPFLQQRIKTHSLHKLITLARHLMPGLSNMFPRYTAADVQQFQLLQKAYIHARYKNNFNITEQQCRNLWLQLHGLLHQLPTAFSIALQTHLPNTTHPHHQSA
ncbi:HEPN domain-containing protein [Phnomibacter ginsenosidimutans]|uniref:HEPN domain-containing protein n=1 Tax=Phnomibacter ginsenosidimutans TaxID=2676868 RepID=A0A6I6GBC3_9BACT|nr:HEPN domain-containing protein [Phnomibacter ginsenosidimutans]QGW29734.1 HEPN domain-containing protein [Phnomibacter ginsenosidimutans]